MPPWGGLTSLPWTSLGLLELTALPTIPRERWLTWVEAADVVLVDGGDAAYLAYWMRESGLAEAAPLADRQSLGRRERRQHGHDPADRHRLRLVAGRRE
jgi:hypothetical protein